MDETKREFGKAAQASDRQARTVDRSPDMEASGNGEPTVNSKAELTVATKPGGLAALTKDTSAQAAESEGESGATNPHARPVSDVAQLSPEMRELVERMLIEGATFEDVCDAANERGVPVTLQAVQNCYRGDMELQKRRIRFQVERAEMLKAALANPDSADAQLANAAILTGLQSLSRKDAGLSLRDAVRSMLERRNLKLRHRLLEMKIQREEQEKQFRKTRLAAELLKLDLTRERIRQLRELLKHQGQSATLGPEAMEKIQEIYGLLRIPVIPRDVEPCE